MTGQAVLITGASGRLATLLRMAWALAPPDFTPIWAARRRIDGIPTVLWRSGEPLPEVDFVLHLAGVTAGNPQALAINAALARDLCRKAPAAGVRHILAMSSAAVYGPTPDHRAHEADTPHPVSAYGAAKLTMEETARNATGDIGLTLLRLGNVVGADALLSAPGQVVLDRVAGQGGGPIRSYIGPRTLAAVLARLIGHAQSGAALPDILNIAAPHPVSMAQVLAASGRTWQWHATRQASVARVVLDTSRLSSIFDFAPTAHHPTAMIAEHHSLTGARP